MLLDTDLDQSIPQRTTTYVSRTAAVARAAMRTRCLRSQIRCIRCQSAAPSATRLASGTKTKIDATEIRTQIASAVSRIARPGVCQQSQVWMPRNRVETEYQTGITFPSTRAEWLSIFNCDSDSSRDAAGFTNADTENSTPNRVRTTKRVTMFNKCIRAPIDSSLKTLSNGALMQKAALTKLSVGVIYGRLKKRNLTMPHRCDIKHHRRAMEGHDPLAAVGRAHEDERTAEEYS